MRLRGNPLLLRAALALCVCAAAGCSRGPRGPGAALAPDATCLAALRAAGISFLALQALEGVRTPVRLGDAVAGVRLVPRGARKPDMDCALARALWEAGPVLRALEIDALEFSAAYDFRKRRDARGAKAGFARRSHIEAGPGPSQPGPEVEAPALSAHAHGLAMDVHAVHRRKRSLDVARDYEPRAGAWRKLRPGPGALAACVGAPRTQEGRALRELACRLKLHTAFRVVVTPDDNADHRDHLHLEVYPDAALPPPAGAAPDGA
jgi:hypothetical protein